MESTRRLGRRAQRPVRPARRDGRRADDDAGDPRAEGVGARPPDHAPDVAGRRGGRRAGPGVDEVIVYEAPWMKATAPRADASRICAMIERLRRAGFDAAVIFTVYSQNPLPAALLCYLAGIPLRLAHCRENPYQLLTDWVPEPEPEQLVRHEVRRQLDLVATVGCRHGDERLSLRVPDRARRTLDGLLEANGVGPDRPWVVIHPGATAPSRRYPPESFAEAARPAVRDGRLRRWSSPAATAERD